MKNTMLRFPLFILLFAITFYACKKDKISLEGQITLDSSDDYPLGIVNEWNLLANATSYEIYRSDDAANYELIKIFGSDINTYFDDSVEEEITYEYYINAISSEMEGVVTSNITSGKSIPLTTENSFGLLANLTGGVYNSTSTDSLTITIASIIDSFATDSADIMLLIDKTGSMWDDIVAVQGGLTMIIAALPPHCRLGLATYGDLVSDSVWLSSGSGSWYDFEDLTLIHSNIQIGVNNLSTTGGGDTPESVFDGLHRTITKADWQANNKLLLVIGDAPPLVVPCTLPLTPAQPVECTMNSVMDVVAACLANDVVTNLYPVVVPTWKSAGGN